MLLLPGFFAVFYPKFFLQKSVGNLKPLDTFLPLSHSEDTLSRR